MNHKLPRRLTSIFLALVFAFAGFQPAMAAPPANDNFAGAEAISTLPFSATIDNSEASIELDEPSGCYSRYNTVWYSLTPSETVALRANTRGSGSNDILNVYQSNGPEFSDLTWLGCTLGGPVDFQADADKIYYFQAGTIYGGIDSVQINLEPIFPPANDDFGYAMVIPSPLPFDAITDTSVATMQSDEPTPSCAWNGATNRTIWFAFTPTSSEGVILTIPNASFTPVFAVYTGDSLESLTEMGCQYYSGSFLPIQVNVGTTYYIQVGNLYPGLEGGSVEVHLDTTPPPVVSFGYYPDSPSVFDTILFYDNSYDPGGLGFQSFTWDFGDDSTSTDQSPTHRYASDGDYMVEHSVTTVDGRTASTSQVVQVRTHDVTLTKVSAPESAKPGRTATITVFIVNTSRYAETVTVHLYRSVAGGGFEWIGDLSKSVPNTRNDERSTRFTFNYTFSPDDAAIGKVIFQAEATIDNVADAFPQDNLRLSDLTRVRR